MHPNNDLEKGKSSTEMTERPRSFTRLINVSEGSLGSSPAPKLGGGAVKWGKVMNGNAHHVDQHSDTNQNKINIDKEERVKSVEAPKGRPVSKWAKMMGKQDPINEVPESNHVSNLHNPNYSDNHVSNIATKSDNFQMSMDVKLDHMHTSEDISEGSVTVRDISVSTMSPAERQLIASLYDIRIEIKEEMDGLNQKMTRIDEQMSEILRLFSPSSSPCSSHGSTYPTSKVTSPQNTGDEHTSVESSPKRKASDFKFNQKTSNSSHSDNEKKRKATKMKSHVSSSSSESKNDSEGSRGGTPTAKASGDTNSHNVAGMCDDVLKMDVKSKLIKAHPRGLQGKLKYSSNVGVEKPPSPPRAGSKISSENIQDSASNKSDNVESDVSISGIMSSRPSGSDQGSLRKTDEKSGSAGSNQSASSGLKIPTDELGVHVKDRDLDIL